MQDPEDVVTDSIYEHQDALRNGFVGASALAQATLEGLTKAGWRIVRTEQLKCPLCGRRSVVECPAETSPVFDSVLDSIVVVVEEWSC